MSSKTVEICDIWGRITDDETRTRRKMKFIIRLCYLSREPHGDASVNAASAEFEARVTAETPLSDAYSLLNAEQRKSLRESIENPPLRVFDVDRTELFIDHNLDLLGRLERGETVGPVDQKQLPRLAGTKAF